MLPPLALNALVSLSSASIGVRDDVPRFFRARFHALRQQHHTTSSSCANPRQISSDIVLWKERCRGHADGSGSPRRAFVFTHALHSFYAFTCNSRVAFKERKQELGFLPLFKKIIKSEAQTEHTCFVNQGLICKEKATLSPVGRVPSKNLYLCR